MAVRRPLSSLVAAGSMAWFAMTATVTGPARSVQAQNQADAGQCGSASTTAEIRLAACDRVLAAGQLSNESKSKFARARAQALADLGRIEDAMASANAAIDWSPNSGESYLLRATVRPWHDPASEASVLADFETALSLGVDESAVRRARADYLWRRGAHDRSLADLDAIAARNPADPSAQSAPIIARVELGRTDDARRLHDKAFAGAPESFAALVTGLMIAESSKDAVATELAATRVLSLSPDDTKALMSRGLARLRQGKHSQAFADFDRVIELVPSDGRAYFFRAMVHLRRDDSSKAVADLTRAIDLAPGFAPAHAWRASALWSLGQTAESERDFDEAIRLDPSNADSFRERARLRLQLGAFDEAIQDLDAAIAIEPGFAHAHALRADALFRLGRPEDAGEVMAAADRALALDPASVLARIVRAERHASVGRTDDARVDLDAAVVHANEAWLLSRIGEAYRDGLKDTEAAMDVFMRARATNPSHGRSAQNLADLLVERGRLGEAAAIMDEMLKVYPPPHWALDRRAMIRFATGDFEGAADDMQRRIELQHADVDWSLLLHVALVRSGKADRSPLPALRRTTATDQWPGILIGVLLGDATYDAAETARRLAPGPRSDFDRARLDLFAAFAARLGGDAIRARVLFQRLANRKIEIPLVSAIVAAELAQLESDPSAAPPNEPQRNIQGDQTAPPASPQRAQAP